MNAERSIAELDQAELVRLREGYRQSTTLAVEVGAATMYSNQCAQVEEALDEKFPDWRKGLSH